MAGPVICDGFDSYNGVGAVTATVVSIQSKWSLPGGSAGLTLTAGLDAVAGTQAATFTSGSALNALRILTNGPRAAGTTNFRMKWTAFPTNATLLGNFCLKVGGTFQMGVRVNSDGTISVYRLSSSTAGTLLGQSLITSPKVVLNTIHHLGIVWTLSTTVGAVTIMLDGVAILTLTNVNNANAGAGTLADTFDIEQSFGNNSVFIIDDYYETDDAVFAGQAKVLPLRPNADTATKSWVPNSGVTNFSRVNENLVDGDTTFVTGSIVGDLDLYANGGLASAPASILGVQIACWGEKTDTASRSIALSCKSGATSSDGPNFALIQSYGAKMERFMATDPNTAAAWLNANVTALTFGPKVTV